MSLATGHGFFLHDIAATVDMQFDASGRLYILTISLAAMAITAVAGHYPSFCVV